MPKKPKPPVTTYSISVADTSYGQAAVATVSPVPPAGLWVYFDINGSGWSTINWRQVINGVATHLVSSPTYNGTPGTGIAFVGDGLDNTTYLSNVANFTVTP